MRVRFNLSSELYPEFTYMVDLYDSKGAIRYDSYPTFFVKMTYSSDITYIYQNVIFEKFSLALLLHLTWLSLNHTWLLSLIFKERGICKVSSGLSLIPMDT